MEHQQNQTRPPEPQRQYTWNVEDIPKAFLAVATRRERVNGERVGVGDKRMQLHRDLDNLTQSVESLQSVFKSLLSHSAGDLFRDASAQVEQFNASLSRFRATKTEYDELDDKLCGGEWSPSSGI
ncbi:hypothetical protein VTN00DRAFT_2726 [Thermoascus crustaceus]|uniref:uncharacterized protein n=1 Tax=Thermoascus crustaceus TaxID=5088 RepID=UPI003744ABB3